MNPQTGEEKQREIQPHETVWTRYEEIFTANYKTITNDYKKFLLEFKEGEYNSGNNLPYLRVWTKPVTTYAMNYSKFDISLAPIKNHIFNRMKSQLKVIEAGFYKKALIASEVGPYTIDLVHCLKNGEFNEEGNAILIPESRNHSDWSKAIKKLVQNPEMIKGYFLLSKVRVSKSLVYRRFRFKIINMHHIVNIGIPLTAVKKKLVKTKKLKKSRAGGLNTGPTELKSTFDFIISRIYCVGKSLLLLPESENGC